MNLTSGSTIFRNSLAITLLCLAGGLICIGLLDTWQRQLAESQLNQLGETLVNQLAASAEQPLFQKDLVSLQVQLSSVTQNNNIHQASIYSADKRLLAQSEQRESQAFPPEKEHLATFSKPITIDNAIAGYAMISIERLPWRSLYRGPVIDTAWVLSAVSLLLIVAVWLFSRSISRRLCHLADMVPTTQTQEDNPRPKDELEALEHSLTPLLTAAQAPPVSLSREKFHAIVLFRVRNLTRLHEQLNQNNYESLINLVDSAVAKVCQLYSGERLSGDVNIIRLSFSSLVENGDHPLRALSGIKLLFDLLTEKTRKQGVELELSAALALHKEQTLQTISLRDGAFEAVYNSLGKIADLGAGGEILVSEYFSQQESIAEETRFTALGEDSTSYRFEEFNDKRRQLLAKQLEYLIQIG